MNTLDKVSFKPNFDTLFKIPRQIPSPSAQVLWLFYSLLLCFLIHITHDIVFWVYDMSEHVKLGFLTNILAPSASGCPCLPCLGGRFCPRSLLLCALLGVLKGIIFPPVLVISYKSIQTHTIQISKPQLFIYIVRPQPSLGP